MVDAKQFERGDEVRGATLTMTESKTCKARPSLASVDQSRVSREKLLINPTVTLWRRRKRERDAVDCEK